MQIGYALEEILNPKMKRKRAKHRKKSASPALDAETVFASMTEMSVEDAQALKAEFEAGGTNA